MDTPNNTCGKLPDEQARTWQRLSNVFFASFGFLILRFLLVPIRIKLLTHLLSKEHYGTLTIVSSTVSLIALAASMGSLEFLLLKLPGRPRDYQQGILKTVMMFFGGIATAIALLAMPVLWLLPTSQVLFSPSDILACGILLVLTVHLGQRSFYLLGTMDYSRSRLTQLLFADLWFVPVLFFLGWGALDMSAVLWIWVLWYVLTLVVTHRWMAMGAVCRAHASRGTVTSVLQFSLPLVPMILGDMLTRRQDQYVLLGFTDPATLAGYVLAMGIAVIGVQMGDSALDLLITDFFRVRNSIRNSSIAVLANDGALRFRFSLMIRCCMVISFGVAMGQAWLAEPVILFLSNPDYLDAARLLPWLAPFAAVSLLNIIFCRVFIALNWRLELGIAALTTAALNLGINLLLIPMYGSRGAAITATLSIAALAAYLAVRIQCWRWMDLRVLRLGRLSLLLATGMAAFWAIATWLPAGSFVKLVAAGTAFIALVVITGVFTGEDIALFKGLQKPSDPELIADSDRRETL